MYEEKKRLLKPDFNEGIQNTGAVCMNPIMKKRLIPDEYSINIAEFIKKITASPYYSERNLLTVLKARGFLFEYRDEMIYLSDNLCLDDWPGMNTMGIGDHIFLNKTLKKYNMGYIERVEEKMYSESGFSLQMNIIRPPEFTDLCNIFKDYQGLEGNCTQSLRYGKRVSDEEFFYNRMHGLKVPVSVIEPGIARFVKSLTACGISTSMSCDGHFDEKKNAWIKFKSHMDLLWFRLIIDGAVFPLKSPDLSFNYAIPTGEEYMDVRILKNSSDIMHYYQELQNIAQFLYKNRVKFRIMKNSICKEYLAKNSEVYSKKHYETFSDSFPKNYPPEHMEEKSEPEANHILPNVGEVREKVLDYFL
ncbi:MAG: hypothetical protein PHV39_09380 [Methanomicrobium sp.]|nr:hypothetical protein [Methanomicrobium sp.]